MVWDLKDRAGEAVAPGTYRYRIEGNISWASAACTAPEAAKLGNLISAVTAVYEPGN